VHDKNGLACPLDTVCAVAIYDTENEAAI